MTDSPDLPTTQELCTGVALYKAYDIPKHAFADIRRLERQSETIDAYCIGCAKESVFEKDVDVFGDSPLPKGSKAEAEAVSKAWHNRDFEVSFACSRDTNHTMIFYFRIHDLQITKVGQYPSLADLHLHSIGKYKRILGQQEYKELARAIGLYAHGIT